MLYNVRIKTFPDGHKQYFFSYDDIFRLDEEGDSPELVQAVKAKRKRAALCRAIRSFDVVDIEEDGNEIYLRQKRNVSRSVNEVYDIARANAFDWFITLTFDGKKVDRYDYDACVDAVKMFTDRLRKMGCKWLIVPEQHKDGAYHFHGLVAGSLPLTPSGKTCYNEAAKQDVPIYNLANYEFGFTTVTKVVRPDRTASYIAKYLTKQIAVPKGRKCYWASRSLARPSLDYVRMDVTDFVFGVYAHARYSKEIKGEYGTFLIAEE